MVTSFALIVDFIDEDGERGWATAHTDGQSSTTTLGLLRFHPISVEQQTKQYLRDED